MGKLKEKYLKQGIEEYAKRLTKYCKFNVVEVPDEKAPENLSAAEMIQVKEKEGERILAKVKDQDYIFALAINGTQYSSEGMAQQIDKIGISGKSSIVFIIGGSLGLSDEVLHKSNQLISFWETNIPPPINEIGASGTNLPKLPNYPWTCIS